MPRYYFDWEIGGHVERDPRGMKLSDLETAIEVATDCACDLATEDVVGEASVSAGAISVRDSAGNIVHRITLAEARVLAEAPREWWN
jgi:hypothetical protein